MATIGPEVAALARALVRSVVGTATRIDGLAPLQATPDGAVLLVDLAGGRRLVLKMTPPEGSAPPWVDFERTAAVAALARSAGAPVAEVLAASAGTPSFLLQEHVDGVAWRRLRPQLDEAEVRLAHRQIATALLAVQAVRFPSFGELGAGGRPAGNGLVAAVRSHADLRIRDAARRAAFAAVLDRYAYAFAGGNPTLTHDDLHHGNVVFARRGGEWRLTGLLDWDKAWAGPSDSDVARMTFWDDMTGPGFWDVYPTDDVPPERTLVHQLLWCLEYGVDTPRHRADTARLCRALGVLRLPPAPASPSRGS